MRDQGHEQAAAATKASEEQKKEEYSQLIVGVTSLTELSAV